ncbi:hypothetical protein ONE63_009080 [Megalurothrips usitatus]|uniref:Uncharacterized protein n=1 Tax=Megalurothrips usitatus TaxID=439358 RepID=A0AAV7XMM4_9NEOP|nr:hypothetical protein ONE63_009080 [Megalurothrips usitatus]
MRGKKSDFEDAEYDLEKRARNNLGFSGMRGKKDDFEDPDDAGLVDKRARNNLGFSGMRGKKDDFEDPDDGATLLEKRARNNLGFSGMRGKKDGGDLDDVLGADGSAFDKRARNTLGFSGMRGKKAGSGEMVMEDLVDKRAGSGRNSLGFSGMRGKKDEALARSAFVGMRGRRENKQAFFGMRGKREAAHGRIATFRSKRYLPAHWQVRNSKKTPFSGFIGLRGKKSYIPSSECAAAGAACTDRHFQRGSSTEVEGKEYFKSGDE